MRLRTRLARVERGAATLIDLGPITLAEAFRGTRDHEYRRRLGPEGVRLAAERLRAFIERVADPPASLPSEEGGLKSISNQASCVPENEAS